jgi:catechol 2,3-dioxygenase-like lactoylglutathione lyase family enzyme
VISLPLVLDQGDCRVYRTCGNAYLGFCKRAGAPQPSKTEETHSPTQAPLAGLLYTLVTDDVDGWYNYLQQCGVEIEAPPKLNETYGIYHFFVRDPNGYLIEIQNFLDPNWLEKTITAADELGEKS